MTIFRNNKDGRLVLIFLTTPRQWIGQWYEEVDYYTGEVSRHKNGQTKKVKLENYTAVSYA